MRYDKDVPLCWRVTNFVGESVFLIEGSDEGVCPDLNNKASNCCL
ncbi:MAG: hypothetical protein OXU51_26435 [Candidatus Poribacteria bacterium]|nr:hypothetical protein [Candidatus Poribacteria bacterium]